MAAFDHVRDINDVALRPRLLRTVLREHLPDDKRPLGSPSQLSKAISVVKTHSLLSENIAGDRTDQKLLDASKSAVDAWLERVSQLASNDMPDKCWAGICLLGVTFQECSSERFVASYSVWFQNLLSHIQSPAASHFVKVAACASISDLIARLSGFPSLKKDGTALAGRVVQPVLKLLNDNQSEAIWDGAVDLICNIITFFSYAISRHYDSVEAAIATKLLPGNCSFTMLKKLAHCLALLPKTRGDEESWSLMIQRILIRVNVHLNDAFQGFEEENKSWEVIRLLVPPGKDLPSPFGELPSSGDQANSSPKKRSERLSTSTVSALMLCCCTMLTSSYPVQVTVPVRSILALVERVLMVDGSLPKSTQSFVTAMQQELLSSELPALHQNSLELLTAVIKGVRSQLLPHAASIVRLISDYFKHCALPELRVKIYSISKILLISMGVGMALCLAKEVVNNALVDLSPVDNESNGISSNANLNPAFEALTNTSRKKRKHNATIESHENGREISGFDVAALKNSNNTSLISLRVAALEALEALLSVGGALKSEGWRSNLDIFLINMAKNYTKGGWANEERNIWHANEATEVWANVQLAALRALLASFLSSRVRSPYLAQGLELFREGKNETGTKIAEFCAHALLALEVLLHPRVLSVDDFPTANCTSDGHKFPDNIFSENANIFPGNVNHSTPIMGHTVLDSDIDELCESWLQNGKEKEEAVDNPVETISFNENPTEPEPVHQASVVVGEIDNDEDEIMAVSHQFAESIPENEDTVPEKVLLDREDSRDIQMSPERITSDKESDSEEFPDIVEADPDSDSE